MLFITIWNFLFRWFSHLQTQLNPASVIFSRTLLYWCNISVCVVSNHPGVCTVCPKSLVNFYVASMIRKFDDFLDIHFAILHPTSASLQEKKIFTFPPIYQFFFPSFLFLHFLHFMQNIGSLSGKKSVTENAHLIFHFLRCSIILFVIFLYYFTLK